MEVSPGRGIPYHVMGDCRSDEAESLMEGRGQDSASLIGCTCYRPTFQLRAILLSYSRSQSEMQDTITSVNKIPGRPENSCKWRCDDIGTCFSRSIF